MAIGRIIGKMWLTRKKQDLDTIATITKGFTKTRMDEYNKRFNKRKRSIFICYMLLGAGLHYFYLGKPVRAFFFICTIGGLLTWFFYDAVLMFMHVDKRNREIKIEVLTDMLNEGEPEVSRVTS